MSLGKRIPEVVGLATVLICAGGCDTLNIKNPNAPDSPRALSDPSTVQSIAVGAVRTWYLTMQGDLGADAYPACTMVVKARSHVAACNNDNIRFYTGCTAGNWDVYTTATNGTCGTEQLGATYPRVEWQNDPASAQRTQIEPLWYGYYSALSSANDVLKAIRQKGIVITDADNTKMVETMATLVQALSLSHIAQIANTMAARTLAYFPRNAAQNAAVDWARVTGYASKGISSGTPFDWVFHDDACASWCDWLKVWSNDMTTMRIHSRVAHLLD